MNSGGLLRDGLHPNDEEQWRIRGLRDAHEDDLVERLEKAPPAAFVFLDKLRTTEIDGVIRHYRKPAAY